MRDKSEITDLFKKRLAHAELEVRDGFWETLERDLTAPAPSVRPKAYVLLSRRMSRWTAVAASVLLVLGVALAVLWKPAPQAGREAARHLASLESQEPRRVPPQEAASSPVRHPVAPGRGDSGISSVRADAVAQPDEVLPGGEPVSVRVSITITQRQYGGHPQARRRADNAMIRAAGGHPDAGAGAPWRTTQRGDKTPADGRVTPPAAPPHWALKASLGTSLPKGGYRAPLIAGLGVERRLGKRLSLEAGVQYSYLHGAGDATLHTLGIPVQLNVLLAGNDKVELYALAGGAVEKCVAGARDNSFEAEPVQCSVKAGLGVRYKMTDRLALFAEPAVSHHFDTDSPTRTLRTERPTNLNLQCGLRMIF